MDKKTGKAIYIYSFFSYSISYCVFACTGNSFYWEKVCSIFCKVLKSTDEIFSMELVFSKENWLPCCFCVPIEVTV